MMSSYNRIPKAAIKLSEKKIAFNDKYASDEDIYKKSSVEEYIEISKKKVREEEEKMLLEIENKKEMLIERAQEEGRQRALSEAEQIVRQEFQNVLEEANNVYEKANQHYQKMIEDTEIMKENFLLEKKEELIEFLTLTMSSMINQSVELDKIDIGKIYDRAIGQVKYDTKKIYVRVHPKTQDLLASYKNAQLDNRIEFLYDLSIEEADFIIETDREFIDFSIRTQLDEMKEYLRGVFNAEH